MNNNYVHNLEPPSICKISNTKYFDVDELVTNPIILLPSVYF